MKFGKMPKVVAVLLPLLLIFAFSAVPASAATIQVEHSTTSNSGIFHQIEAMFGGFLARIGGVSAVLPQIPTIHSSTGAEVVPTDTRITDAQVLPSGMFAATTGSTVETTISTKPKHSWASVAQAAYAYAQVMTARARAESSATVSDTTVPHLSNPAMVGFVL